MVRMPVLELACRSPCNACTTTHASAGMCALQEGALVPASDTPVA